jgi:rhamnosyltransferase
VKIAAILVSFDSKRKSAGIVKELKGTVDLTIIVDNCVEGNPELSSMDEAGIVIIRNHNVGGLAGAYNAALLDIATHHAYITHVLFLDDDSALGTLESFLASDVTINAAACPNIAAVAPVYRDRRTGLRGRHIQLDRFRFHFLPREQAEPAYVTFVINSMSLWQRNALERLGPFSVLLGVDHIDTDYAMRAKRAGFKIVLNPAVEFLHEIGERRAYSIFGKSVQSGGHSPSRRFLIGRNTIIIVKRHGYKYPSFLILCIQRLLYETIGICAVEDRKFRKLLSLWNGVFHGVLCRG